MIDNSSMTVGRLLLTNDIVKSEEHNTDAFLKNSII